MKLGWLALILSVYSINSFAETKPVPAPDFADFAGTYKCTGTDPYLNKTYTGLIRIIPQNAVYRLEMEYNTGEKAFGTAGLYDKDTIAVVFQDTKDLKKVGLERYSYSDDGKKIQGYWVYLGKDKLGKEICERVK